MLERLDLTNFKRHKELSVDFTDGLNLIIGQNYKGKSSLLHGVLFALWGYGAVPGGKAVAVNDEAKNAGAELTWSMGGHRYTVTRKGTNATLSKDGEEIAKGATPVAAELESLFGMDKARFAQLKHSAQKNTEALLTLGAAKLHQIIEEISGADVVSRVIDACKTLETECKGGLEALPEADAKATAELAAQLQKDLTQRHADLEQAKAARDEMKRTLQEGEKALQSARANNQALDQREKDAAEIAEQMSVWEQNLKDAQAEVELTRGQAAKLEDLNAEVDRLKREQYEVHTKVQQRTKVKRTLEGLQARQDKYEADAAAAEAALDALPEARDMEPLREAVTEASGAVAAVTDRYTRAKKAAENSTCPTCKRPMDEHTDPEALQREVDELADEVGAARAKKAEKEAEYKAAEKVNKDRAAAEAEVERAQSALGDNNARLRSASDELADLDVPPEAELNGLAQRLGAATTEQAQAAQAAGRLHGARQSVAQAEDWITSLTAKQEKLPAPWDRVDTTSLEESTAEVRGKIAEADTFITSAEEGYRIDYGRWKEADTEAKAAAQAAEKREALSQRLGTAGQLKKFLSTNRDRYLTGVWDGVMANASAFATACTDGYISRVVRTPEGAFRYVEGEVERPVDAASGAQRSIMGLGVQLALDSMLPCPFQTLLLDEPTADADEQHSLAIASMLSAAGKQLVMVSHRALDGAVAENVLEVA